MKAIIDEYVSGKKVRAIILSDQNPASTSISGADVENVPNDIEFAFGSVLITPSKKYIAFEDGTFTEKE
ncbi:MAG: hypothetical protein IKG01_14900 [Lachnospiraceae bacterium]|nr:hypothetical protein [Lachnospiraceae bacterium]